MGLTSENLNISELMEYVAFTQNNVLHDSAFMQTFCLLKELLCIGGHVYCTVLQTEDEAAKSKRKSWVQASSEISVDCFHTDWAQAVDFVKQWLL